MVKMRTMKGKIGMTTVAMAQKRCTYDGRGVGAMANVSCGSCGARAVRRLSKVSNSSDWRLQVTFYLPVVHKFKKYMCC